MPLFLKCVSAETKRWSRWSRHTLSVGEGDSRSRWIESGRLKLCTPYMLLINKISSVWVPGSSSATTRVSPHGLVVYFSALPWPPSSAHQVFALVLGRCASTVPPRIPAGPASPTACSCASTARASTAHWECISASSGTLPATAQSVGTAQELCVCVWGGDLLIKLFIDFI